MPRKETPGYRYVLAATDRIKSCGELRDLYVMVYEKEPTRDELQGFRNRFVPSRSNPNCDFLGLCVEKIPALHNVTLAELFGIEGSVKKTGKSPQ